MRVGHSERGSARDMGLYEDRGGGGGGTPIIDPQIV